MMTLLRADWRYLLALALAGAVAIGFLGARLGQNNGPVSSFSVPPRAGLAPARHINRPSYLPPLRASRLSTAALACQARGVSCRAALTQQINGDRALVGSRPLTLDWTQSRGTGSCPGAAGHARHMAQMGQISHDQFPSDVCIPWQTVGENVGLAYGSKYDAMEQDYAQMMAEPWTPGCQDNHHCNLMYGGYTKIGVGFAQSGAWYVSEEFAG